MKDTHFETNKFERDLGKNGTNTNNVIYQLDNEFTKDDLSKVLQDWTMNQLPRLRALKNYYMTENVGINTRANRTGGWVDYRKSAPFARQISDFITAFSVGNPVAVSVPNGSESNHIGLDEFNRLNDIDGHNYDVWLDTSIYGRGYELMYHNEQSETRIVRIDPQEGIAIYNTDIQPKMIAFVRVITNALTESAVVDLVVYKANTIETYTDVSIGMDIKSEPETTETNPFNRVPAVEYFNNPNRTGDFEAVIDMIDLYDYANNDTANFLTDLPNATLVLSGALNSSFGTELDFDTDEGGEQADVTAKQARDMRRKIGSSAVMTLNNGTDDMGNNVETKAQYLHPDYDVSGNEAYKTRLENEIFRGAYVPNLTQLTLGGNIASGVAMQYKLIGTIQVAMRKRRLFEKGLHQRYETVSGIEGGTGWGFDTNDLKFTFTDNLPQDEVAILTQLHGMGLEVPQEHLVTLIPSVTDPSIFLKQMQEEKDNRDNEYIKQAQRDNVYDKVEE